MNVRSSGDCSTRCVVKVISSARAMKKRPPSMARSASPRALLEGIDGPDQRVHLAAPERVLQHEEPVLVVLAGLRRRDGAERPARVGPGEATC